MYICFAAGQLTNVQNAEKKQKQNFDFYGKLLYRYYKIQSKVMRKRHE